MNTTRDQHQTAYHYADGVTDMLGLSTPHQLAIRTAIFLALREQAAGYDATVAELSTKLHVLTEELASTWRSDAEADTTLSTLLANVKTSEAPATISTNGTHAPARIQIHIQENYTEGGDDETLFVTAAAQESAAQDPTPAPSIAPVISQDRKPHAFRWQMLDDQTLAIVQALDAGRQDWRSLQRDDKRIIVTAAITELQLDMAPGQTLGLMEFDRRRPIWMSGWSYLTQTLGRTWTQMIDAVTRV